MINGLCPEQHDGLCPEERIYTVLCSSVAEAKSKAFGLCALRGHVTAGGGAGGLDPIPNFERNIMLEHHLQQNGTMRKSRQMSQMRVSAYGPLQGIRAARRDVTAAQSTNDRNVKHFDHKASYHYYIKRVEVLLQGVPASDGGPNRQLQRRPCMRVVATDDCKPLEKKEPKRDS
jgi:hypothetical protein